MCKDVRAEIRPCAREREEDTKRVPTSIACTSVRAHTYVHARVSERDGVSGSGKGGWRGERERKGKIREFACAPVRDREESEKEKGTSGIEGEEEKERQRERE